MTDPVRVGRPEAAATIWRRTSADVEARLRQASANRRASVLRALVAGLAGGAFLWFERPVMAAVAWTVGGVTLLAGLLSPLGVYASIDRAVARVGDGIGLVLTWVLLTPVYYLFFAPFGLLLRRGARDKLERRIDKGALSYWRERPASRPLDRPY